MLSKYVSHGVKGRCDARVQARPHSGVLCAPTLMEALMRPPLLCTFNTRSKS